MNLLGFFLLLCPATGIIGFDGAEITRKPQQYLRHHRHRSQHHGTHMLNHLKVKPAWDIEPGLVHLGRSSTRTIIWDFADKPKLLGAIEMMRAEICAAMKKEHGEKFASFLKCVKFMMGACKPGKDKVMDGDKKEHSSHRGYCKRFFPPAELSQRAEDREKEAQEKKRAVQVTKAEKEEAEAGAAAAETAEAEAKNTADEEQAAEDAARVEAQNHAAAEAVAKDRAATAVDAAGKKKAEEEEASAAAKKRKAEEAAAAAAARRKAARKKERMEAEKKARDKQRALQKKLQEEKQKVEALEAAKDAAEAAAEAAIAEAQYQQAAVQAKLESMQEKYSQALTVANAPGPAPVAMDAATHLPGQGFDGFPVKHEDGDTMTQDWMQERTPASQLCAICAKQPSNLWCKGQCMKSRVREAVGGSTPAEAETPPEPKPCAEQPCDEETDDDTHVRPGRPLEDIERSSARKSSLTIFSVVTSILVLFSN